MTLGFGTCHRPRNAAATRGAILEAANCRFAAESYDQVGVRDIARDVGVDPALISRYFGSKEELFATVLETCGNAADLMAGERTGFGRRIAHELVYPPDPDSRDRLRGLLIILRSIGSPKAMEVVQRSVKERFHDPLAEWISGDDRALRARLAGGIIMGMAVSREVSGGFGLTSDECERLFARLSTVLQSVIDD